MNRDEWRRLERMRDLFLSEEPVKDYWQDQIDVALYRDLFGERIGWKWDAVLEELTRLGWSPAPKLVVDWGCGPGVAGIRVARWAGAPAVMPYDRSRFAMAEAREGILRAGLEPVRWSGVSEGSLLVLSHLIGELSPEALKGLLKEVERAESVIWVEPGSRLLSLKLAGVRKRLLERGYSMVAPCPAGDMACPMLSEKNHWCHFFATAPNEIFHSRFWREASERLKIDLRSLPYSYIAVSRTPHTPSGEGRMIGRPRRLKMGESALFCHPEGLREEGLR